MPNVRKNQTIHIEYDLNDDVIDFWHKDLQYTKVNGNGLLHPNGWLNNLIL